jgi:hypothetical protein
MVAPSRWRSRPKNYTKRNQRTTDRLAGDLKFLQHRLDPTNVAGAGVGSNICRTRAEVAHTIQGRHRTTIGRHDRGRSRSGKIYRRCIGGSRQFGHEKEDDMIVQAVISLAQSLRLNVVAEGVETAEQASLLLSWGCDYCQRHHFGIPMDATAFGALLMSELQDLQRSATA